uniref:TOG domain-containing protein n=1 Tax=Caenorhabditis tropicalis TaxID=1561998 RepID=A0A1I7TAB4_9PELO
MKWQERRRSLESFLQTLTGKKCILSNISYDASIKKLQKIIRNDANIFCQVLAIRSVTWVATELGAEFSKFSVSLLPDLLEKMKEKKQILRKPLIRCTLEVGKTLPLEDGIPVILSALSMANPEIKKQTMLFVVQQLEAMQMERLKGFIPSLLPVLVELTKNATQDVREVAVHALESIYWKIGRSIGSIIYSGEELHAARFSRSNCIRVDLEDQFIRPNLLVGLLKILETHAADTTSLNLYECSDVLVRDDTEKNGAREERRLAAAILNESADFAAIVNCLIKLLDALKLSPTKDGDNFHLEISDNQTFRKFNLMLPVAAFEIKIFTEDD